VDEEGQRREAIAMLRRGISIIEICAKLGRTRRWLSKWRRRVESEGAAALRGRIARSAPQPARDARAHRSGGARRA